MKKILTFLILILLPLIIQSQQSKVDGNTLSEIEKKQGWKLLFDGKGNMSVTILLLSNIAWKLNRVLNLNKSNGHILNDEEAMKYWRREYEPGWELKV